MNIWDHSRLSKRKFGGKEKDFYEIHKFIDSSKLFYYNTRHRLLLHNLYGIELTVEKFGDVLVNSDGIEILVRDIAAEHCKEDLSGRVPSLFDWLEGNDDRLKGCIEVPEFSDKVLEEFVLRPLFRSNLKSSLFITLSNFGLYLVSELMGVGQAKILQEKLGKNVLVETHLKQFHFTANWQFTPCRTELKWLKENQKFNGNNRTA